MDLGSLLIKGPIGGRWGRRLGAEGADGEETKMGKQKELKRR